MDYFEDSITMNGLIINEEFEFPTGFFLSKESFSKDEIAACA
jgi:hypothetical protein